MPTGNRPAFFQQALRCFLRQTYTHSELIVVDDGERPVAPSCRGLERVRYVRLREPTLTGTKLNIGIEGARGRILQKLDDDDYYSPDFLAAALRHLPPRRRRVIVAWDCFLILLAGESRLRRSGHGWRAGGTMCFRRSLWRRTPFRDAPSAVDHYLFEDSRADIIRVCAPHDYVLVRHGGNTWTHMAEGDTADEFIRTLPFSRKPLEAIIDPRDVGFYRSLHFPQASPR
jgi:glycosyltransferase involved in cell wall biosynthesis